MRIDLNQIKGLPPEEQKKLRTLIDIFNSHQTKNELKQKYYDGNVTLQDVNLGIALPKEFRNLAIGCEWGAKTVDVLASRSMFDGFVSDNGEEVEELNEIMKENSFIYQYMKTCRDELKFGCTFATLSAGEKVAKIRFHSPQTASAYWDGDKERFGYGMAIIDTVPDEKYENNWVPSHINLYTDTDIWEIRRTGNTWEATRHRHQMGKPLMVALVWNGTAMKPFGRSRIKKPIRALIDGYIRTIANATLSLEFNTTPQKYILGVTDEQYDAIISDKFKQYIGSFLVATQNPESGQNPQIGQFTQGSLSPHVEMLRILATQFSAATGLTVTDTGVVNDANPTSSDAILAQSQTLVSLAEQLNRGNAEILKEIALMALAITKNKTMEELSDEEKNIIAHFRNPAMPSVSVTADAAIKIASNRQEFSSTDVFLEMIGFDQADIRRIKAQEQRVRGQQLLNETELEEPMDEIVQEPEEPEEDDTDAVLEEVLQELNGLLSELGG